MLREGAAVTVADVTALWAALRLLQKDQDGVYPVRVDNDPALHLARILQDQAVRSGLRAGQNMVVTSSRPGQAERWAAVAAEEGSGFTVHTEDPGEEEVTRRLRRQRPQLSRACKRAVDRWYRPRRGGGRRR